MRKTKKTVALLCAVLLLVFALAACSGSGTGTAASADGSQSAAAPAESESTGEESAAPAESAADAGTIIEGAKVDLDRISVEAVENTEGKEIKIASLCIPYGPFWLEVVSGIESAKALLAQEGYNAQVDIITFEDMNAQAMSDAIETCIVQQYDVITLFGASDTLIPAIDKATAAGIHVYTYNTDTTEPSTRVAFVGQDLYAAGQKSADLMAELLDEKGKVGIITGLFSLSSHELRRTGMEDELAEKYPDITVIPAVECNDNDDVAYTVAKDLITANPDMNGILVTASGQIGVAQAIRDLGLQGELKMVCFDYQDAIVDGLRDNTIQATIAQGPFDQGANPIIYGYNYCITGTPEVEGNAFTALDVITPENVDEYLDKIGYVYGNG
ncbi:sugar ABC transporter substrate-binding protein [Christensenella tenuis]|uniref:Substrate-binding domain-containing protein n=1 Tax=Christensenella tenuis TaxID=2763033 RepID=A0ABR7EHR7_9FIRM|nr:substrate-binding domain-containing protein [Christensenella tenuis]MBC5649312.1 substrate-binding domain-containing protein [Christensenella tenuis]